MRVQLLFIKRRKILVMPGFRFARQELIFLRLFSMLELSGDLTSGERGAKFSTQYFGQEVQK